MDDYKIETEYHIKVLGTNMTFRCSGAGVQNGSILVRNEAGLAHTVFSSIWGIMGLSGLCFIKIVALLTFFLVASFSYFFFTLGFPFYSHYSSQFE